MILELLILYSKTEKGNRKIDCPSAHQINHFKILLLKISTQEPEPQHQLFLLPQVFPSSASQRLAILAS